MYFHQALQQPNTNEFVKAVVKEVNGHVDNHNWEVVRRSDVPPDVEVVPSVWAMRCKQDLTTNIIMKNKARLNLHGGKQVFGLNYFDTYAHVVTWYAIRLLLIFAVLYGWSLRQVNFVMAYPHAPIEMDMFMDFPKALSRSMGTPRITSSSSYATSTDKSKLEEYGTSTW